MSNISRYIDVLKEMDSALEIVTDEAVCQAFADGNDGKNPAVAPKAVVYPTKPEQIQPIVKAANETGVSLVVRSSQGTRSEHASSLPAEGTESVMINLSKMNQIMRIDTRNNMCLIEAGVTYAQLNEELAKRGYYVEHPLLPRADKSVLASLLDREPVMSPKHCWDVPDPLTCVELVMGNGELFRTGSAAGPGTLDEMLESGCAINQPQGPYTLDLVRVMSGAQGTLAIATWASVKIRPIGSMCELVYVQSDDVEVLAAYSSDVIRRRLGENTFIVNKAAFAQITGIKAELKDWIMVSDVRGYRYFPERYLENQIADMEDLAKEAGLTLEKEISGVCNQTVQASIDGISEQDNYWRDRIGENRSDLFFQSTLDRVVLYSKLAECVAEKCGIDPKSTSIYVQPLMMGRSCHVEIQAAGSADQIAEYEKMLGNILLDNKAFFSRPYGELTKQVFAKSSSQTPFMNNIKEFFDEKHVMNPGRMFA
ncbi:FAD/FMN-containing dehydrogenase [Clostridium sp. SY8519]|uniref:FAD-binding oxidoreductase n=1 Tax=Clostridium sp. (strain SY8519) TaxID=1042156 RepID=UPI0002171B67|nr:FAD-binding oxidoreductase [Clostridium sp. SY8519]BAK47579.1 FAD/FMN-containing dehydrogenase [Clostridium sp. SY8519]